MSVAFAALASLDDVERGLCRFRSLPQQLELPSAPSPPIVVWHEDDRPQAILDREAGGGMAVVLGRLCPGRVPDVRSVLLDHNPIRAAAGAAILNA